MKDPDGDLVRRAQKGDRTAYGKLVDSYYEMVYALAFGVLRHGETAKDVTQNVFLKLVDDIRKFEGRSKFKTWLYRIAVNSAIDEARKRRPQAAIDGTDAAVDDEKTPVVVTDSAPSPREHASRDELRQALEDALEKLSEEHRAILVLREWEGLSYDEIAEAIGISKGTVMSRLFYARKKIAEIIGVEYKEHIS